MKPFELRINPLNWIVAGLLCVALIAEMLVIGYMVNGWMTLAEAKQFGMVLVPVDTYPILETVTILCVATAIVMTAYSRPLAAIVIGAMTTLLTGILSIVLMPTQAEVLPWALPFAIVAVTAVWLSGKAADALEDFRDGRTLKQPVPDDAEQPLSERTASPELAETRQHD